MKKTITLRWTFTIVFFVFLMIITGCTKEKYNTRAYFQQLVDEYLDAVVANDPSGLPLSPDVKYTEDTQVRKIGEGLWASASEAPVTFRIYAIDTVSSQVGFYGVLKENDKPVILALRLKVNDGQIIEIEHVVARQISERAMKNLVNPRPAFVKPVPGDRRDTRDEMFNIANLYFEAIERDTGSVAPFADDCVRHENGIQTTTNEQPDPADFGDSPEEQLRFAMAKVDACGCEKQIDIQNLAYITRIWPRRLIIVDEKLGLVFGFPMFVHKGDVQWVKIFGLPGVDTIPKKFPPFNLQAGEIFKISGGKIHEIEANGMVVPYGAGSGWDDDVAVQNSDSEPGSVIIKKCSDFDVTGDGSSKEWDSAEWIDLVSRGTEVAGYHTSTKVLYSETGIYFLFDCKDKKLTTTLTEDNLNLWEEDVVEVFLWTDERFPVYFEYELSPMNYELPIIVPNFDGKFLGWLPWKYFGDKKTRHATSATGGEKKSDSEVTGWIAEFFIPYRLLEPLNNVPPVSGTKWRANMYRIDRDSAALAFNWQKTNRTFHEYKNFGTFVFE